jgi:replicative DNA helicase
MSLEIEAAVLSGMLVCVENAKAGIDRLKSYQFMDKQNQTIFNEVKRQIEVKDSFDVLLVKANSQGVDDETWFLIEEFDDSQEYPEYVEALYRSGRRKALKKLLREADQSLESEDPDAVAATLAERAQADTSTSAGSKNSHTMKGMTQSYMAKFQARVESDSPITGLATGFDDFDEMTCGLGAGNLVIIAGRPAMGKTTFALNIVENVVRRGGRGLLFSLEMPEDEITGKMVASAGSINASNLKSTKLTSMEASRFYDTMMRVNEYNFLCEDKGGIGLAELTRITLKHHREDPLSVIMIDYLQLMTFTGDESMRATQIGVVTAALKNLAKFLGIPIILLSQLNRSLEQRTDKRPLNSDLRESGAIEQDADIIIFVYRDEVYYPTSEDKGLAEIIIGKQRSGPIGTLKLKFEGQYSRFSNIKKESVYMDAVNF